MAEYVCELTEKQKTDLRKRLREQIVRCRDCKYLEPGWYSPQCGFLGGGTRPDGFCAWGEERDSDG